MGTATAQLAAQAPSTTTIVIRCSVDAIGYLYGHAGQVKAFLWCSQLVEGLVCFYRSHS